MDRPPTRAEFNELKEEVRQLREQRTEEIKAVRVEVASEDVLNRLKSLERGLHEISQKQDEQFKQLKADLESLSRRQNEYDKGLVSHSRNISAFQNQMDEVFARFEKIEATMATKQDLAALKTAQDERFEKIEAAMATKQDLAALKTAQDERFTAQDAHFDQIEAEQKQQHEMLRQILRLLGQPPS